MNNKLEGVTGLVAHFLEREEVLANQLRESAATVDECRRTIKYLDRLLRQSHADLDSKIKEQEKTIVQLNSKLSSESAIRDQKGLEKGDCNE